MAPGIVAGAWFLLCLVLLAGPMRRLPRYREVSRAALLMAAPWAVIVAAAMGQRPDDLVLDFILGAAGIPVAFIVFWEWGLVFLLLPLSIIHFLASSEPLVEFGKWLVGQFETSVRGNVRVAAMLGSCAYFTWLLWVVLAARLG
ncbi:MAG: hypothetical protein J7M38_11400 [Armatimonadetes bacterium]|nr:hypothetical protein [Armatimonadota bacterium]